MSRLFVSCPLEHPQFTAKLVRDLRREGHVVFLDPGTVEDKGPLMDRIQLAVGDVDTVIGIVPLPTMEARSRGPDSPTECRTVLLPFLPGLDVPPDFFQWTPLEKPFWLSETLELLAGKLYVDFREDDYQAALSRLLSFLGPPTPEPKPHLPSNIHEVRCHITELRQFIAPKLTSTSSDARPGSALLTPRLAWAIYQEHRQAPAHTPINRLYAFELDGTSFTLAYVLGELRESLLAGRHPVESLLDAHSMWPVLEAMLTAYQESISLSHGDA